MNYSEFLHYCIEDKTLDEKYGNLDYRYAYIARFYFKNRDQNGVIDVTDCGLNINRDVNSSFEGFPVNFGDSFINVKNSIVFLDPNKDIIEDLNYNISEYLSIGTDVIPLPTHIFILSDDREVVSRSYAILEEHYSNYSSTVKATFSRTQVTKDVNVVEEVNSTILARIKANTSAIPVSIYKECELLDNAYGTDPNNLAFIELFNNTVDSLLDKVTDNHIVYFGGKLSDSSYNFYPRLILACYFKRPSFKFYMSDNGVNDICNSIKKFVFNPDAMLVEDYIGFIKGFPRLFREFTSLMPIINVLDRIDSKMVVTCISLDELLSYDRSNPERLSTLRTLSASSVNIQPISKYYDLFNKDLEVVVSEEERLRRLIYDFYDASKLRDGEFIDLTNIMFFVENNVEYVGVCISREITILVSTVIDSITNRLPRALTEKEFERVQFLEPFFSDVDKIIGLYSKSISKTDNNIMYARHPQHRRPSAYPLSLFVFSTDKIKGHPSVDGEFFTDYGLYSAFMTSFRTSLRSKLSEEVGYKLLRKRLDSFGGFNPINNSSFLMYKDV